MRTLLATLLCALSVFTASAQYRYNKTTLPSGTNVTVGSNAVVTFNTAVDVGPSTTADIRLAFRLTGVGTNAIVPAPNCTNLVTATFDRSKDGTYYTNSFCLSAYANSNSISWAETNVSVSQYAWLRLVSISNLNWSLITNPSVFIGNKTGL